MRRALYALACAMLACASARQRPADPLVSLNQLALQYFQRMLGEPEGLRLVYAEGLWSEPAALQLLGTHLLDAEIATAFFGEPRRLHRDLLADAAAEYLTTLLP